VVSHFCGVNNDVTKNKKKMNSQSFKMVNHYSLNTIYQKIRKKKRPIVLFSAILSMLLLFSCKKNMNELPGQNNVETSLSNQSSSANVSSSEELVPYDQILFVPCANSGAGEEVALTGSLKIVEQIVYNDRGFTFNYHVITQGITGVGLSTGEKFQASGGNKGIITGEFGEEGQYSRVFIQQLRIVGQNTVFKVTYKTKITITPDGKVTTSISDETVDCIM
jgi:hypothetical protein